jgi:type III restriction enzyme
MAKTFLYEELNVARKFGIIKQLPKFITNGLNPNINLRDYQIEALENLITYQETEHLSKNKKKHLLFHMATGSGKTVIMAASILYYYNLGYRNFLFFVNSTNIIEKTIANFSNKGFSKYLFNDRIEISGKVLEIKQVDNFQYSDPNAINICFTTIQGLHWDLWNGKENSLSIDDFENNKIVMISDEAHHINADTASGNLSKEDEEDNKSWEYTVNKVFDANTQNVLLEFTATCDLKNNYILDKYVDKLIFDYPLSKFRESGYTKELMNMSTNTDYWTRTLQAMVMSQFRLKLFQHNKINIKPVILLKSQKIVDSRKFYKEFFEHLQNLTENELISIKNINEDNPLIKNAFKFFEENNISLTNLVHEIKLDFSEEHAIIMNQKDEMTPEKQRIVNTLEDPSNPYRIIFTVDMLNEGWDVLNLFDIVRLYNTRQGGPRGSVSKFTIKEAQLIGRGARYCPFKFEDDQESSKRKYDNNVDNIFRICETLLYHSQQDSKYIDELRRALKETGLLPKDEPKEIINQLKQEFVESDIYKNGYIFINKRIEKHRSSIKKLPEKLRLIGKEVTCYSGMKSIIEGLFNEEKTKHFSDLDYENILFKEIPFNITHKAVRCFPNLSFNELKIKFPNLKSIKEFISSEDYLGNAKLTIKKIKDYKLNNDDLLQVSKELLKEISEEVSKIEVQYEGTSEFIPKRISEIIPRRTRRYITIDNNYGVGISQNSYTVNEKYRLDLSKKDWFAYEDNFGTTEEKSFVKYFDKIVENLKREFDDVYLIRNEQQISIYSFENGYKFEPDFILILCSDNSKLYYQVFIEPKGDHLLEKDKWKENFLLEISNKAIPEKIFVDDYKYKIWGLPFYNENNNLKLFDDSIKNLL